MVSQSFAWGPLLSSLDIQISSPFVNFRKKHLNLVIIPVFTSSYAPLLSSRLMYPVGSMWLSQISQPPCIQNHILFLVPKSDSSSTICYYYLRDDSIMLWLPKPSYFQIWITLQCFRSELRFFLASAFIHAPILLITCSQELWRCLLQIIISCLDDCKDSCLVSPILAVFPLIHFSHSLSPQSDHVTSLLKIT